MKIAIVGVCASGKTTLVAGLRAAGYDAYNVAQEHSCIRKRRQVFWDESRLVTQHKRLADARAHADLYIQTDSLTVKQVRDKVIAFIEAKEAGKSA